MPIITTGICLWRDKTRGKTLLLKTTDHKALLESCRELLTEKRAGKWNEGEIIKVRFKKDPDADRLPACILVLNPTYVFIGEDYILIEMLGRYGVIAYAEDCKNEGKYAKRKIIDGLWYFDSR